MKCVYLLFALLLIARVSAAQDLPGIDKAKGTFTSVEQIPEFPGGFEAFGKYLGTNLKYPEVAALVGVNGKLYLKFVVNRDGSISDVTPINCIGAGCEAEAVKLLEKSPHWKPGIQNGRPVRVAFSVPINFDAGKDKVYLETLRKSNYGFIFNIKGALYTMDEAEKILGSSFLTADVQIAEPFYNYNKIAKFDIPDKKEVYLIIFKAS